MHKILLLLARIQIWSGLCLLGFLERKARSDAMNVEATMRGAMANHVGILPTTQPPSERLPIPSQQVLPTENIKKIMTLLAWHGSIMGQTRKSGSRPLAIFKNDSERSVN